MCVVCLGLPFPRRCATARISTTISLWCCVGSCSLWQAAPFRSNNNRQNVAARNSRCQAPDDACDEWFGYCDASIAIATDGALLPGLTSPPQSCHDKCPATGKAQPHQQCSVSRRPVPTNNSEGLARIFHSQCEAWRAVTARYLAVPLPRNTNVPSIDKAAWFPNLSRPLQKRAKRH